MLSGSPSVGGRQKAPICQNTSTNEKLYLSDSHMPYLIIQMLILLCGPYLLAKLTKRMGTENWLSPVVCCYIVGIGLRNLTSFPLNDAASDIFVQSSIILAIPLLLYSTDLLGWVRLAKSTILGFALLMFSVILSSLLSTWLFREKLPDMANLGGMLTAVYIGGTPNLNAVGLALGVEPEHVVMLNAAEIFCGGIYLLLLTSIAPWFFGLFLSDFQGEKHAGQDEFLPRNGIALGDLLKAFALTIFFVACSAGIIWLAAGNLEKPGLIILLISAFGVGASFFPKIRELRGSYESGEYLLLIFSIAIGMMADLGQIFSEGGVMVAFAGLILVLAISFHVVLCRIFRIDRDTMIITSTAGIYGPPFIGQVAAVIKNRSLVFSGIATGLVGIAVANFIGVALAKLLSRFF